MFDTELKKYRNNGTFSLKPSETLSKKCNAPADKGGVYLIYKVADEQELLIYIGSSGQKNRDGTLKVRQGGMKDRLVNGYHPNRFGQDKRIKRQKAFPWESSNSNSFSPNFTLVVVPDVIKVLSSSLAWLSEKYFLPLPSSKTSM